MCYCDCQKSFDAGGVGQSHKSLRTNVENIRMSMDNESSIT